VVVVVVVVVMMMMVSNERLKIVKHCTHKFKVCKFVHHHRIQINQPTRSNNFSSLLLDVYVQLNVFRSSSRPSSGAQQLQ
jgi:hypothetical protein